MSEATLPRLYLISRPSLLNAGLNDFLENHSVTWTASTDTTDAEHLVEVSGRLCYMSFTNDTSRIRHPNSKYIRNLIHKGHESVLEHATWTFILDQVSRAFTHQLVRHRIGFSFSQLSQQYHEEADSNFIRPAGLSPKNFEIWKRANQLAMEAYISILSDLSDTENQPDGTLSNPERKRLVHSAARSVLPNAIETIISVTANGRALRNFLELRGDISGDIEMRLVSFEIYSMLKREAPVMVHDFKIDRDINGYPRVIKK